jgi:hypothetical protein
MSIALLSEEYQPVISLCLAKPSLAPVKGQGRDYHAISGN